MANLNEIRLEIADFLNTNILDFIGLNLWHIIHFASGFFVMYLIMKIFKKENMKEKVLLLLMFLALYEVFEFSFIASGSSFFRGEASTDIFLDVFLGLLGGLSFLGFRKK